MSNAQRIVLVVLAGVVIVGSLVLFTPEDEGDSPPPATQTSEAATGGKTATAKPRPPRPKATRIDVRGGEPAGGVRTISALKGDTVRLVVTADAPSEIHVHGYDLLKSAAPGRPARFTFKAGVEGVFEVELEGPHTQLARLEVRPG